MGRQPDGPALHQKCIGPWCAAKPKDRNSHCGFLFCSDCCRLARARINPKADCPVQDHNTLPRVLHSVNKPVFSAYLDPNYDLKMQMLQLEEQQRAAGVEQSRRPKKEPLTIRWWRKVCYTAWR